MAVTTSQITITTMEGWYSGNTAPSNPLIGDLWLDTTSNEIKKWNGTNWVKQADTQGPQGPKGDSIKSREAYWIKSGDKPDKPTSETIGNWTPGSEPPETVLNNIGEKDKFWRVYKITYSNGENEYSEYSEVELIGSYEVLKGLVQFRSGVTTTENIGGQDVTVIDGGKILTGSVEADKMSIKDLSALKAKIGGFNIGENSIYSGTKSSINSAEKGIYFDSNGYSYFGDDKNYIRFFQSTDDGKYKLQISADSLTFGSSESVERAIDNIEIGGRNLLPDTDFGGTSKKHIVPDGVVEGSGGEGGFRFTPTTQIESGIEYTLSLRMRGVANVTFYELNTGSNIYHTLAKRSDLSETDYKKISLTFVVRADRTFQQVYICTSWGLSATGDWFEIEPKSLKLEKGNKATDWTPAPEDVDAGIANAQTTADSATSAADNAQTAADKAQGAADKAQSSADNAQTAADEALKGTKENAAQMAQMVTDFNGDIKNLQDQIDGNITTWFYGVDPAMNLPPVTDWDTDKKKDAHLGDIYYNTVKGYAWRFMKSGSTYSWERITDTDVTKALADAAKAQDTANSKRRVFYNTPTVPYDAGDLWVQGSDGDILRCAQAKTSAGSYNRNDWILASKYTDNSALNTWIEGEFATTIQELEEGLVDAKIETYYQTTDPSTGWSSIQKSEHKGDLWYNSTASVQKYYRWSGTKWEELTATPPQAVFDSIDNKATIYTGTTPPSSPSQGDLWFKGTNDPILTYVGNTWVKYDKYTDDTKAEKAITNAATAQSTATEAAKTADNYISVDSTGIMVSENTGATKETPSNATKNNVLITDQDVQIRNGQKTVASYGKTSTIGATTGKNMRVSGDGVEIRDGDKVLAKYGASEIILGDLSGDNILLEKARMTIRAGAADKMVIESVTTTKTVTERQEFDGAWLANILSEGKNAGWGVTLKDVIKIDKVSIQTDSGKEAEPASYRLSIRGSYLEIWLDQSNPEAMAVDWTEYTTMEVTYESGSIVSNTKCDKFEAKDNTGKFVSFTEISSGTGTAKATTGRVTTKPNWWRCGNLVQLEFGVAATAAVDPGKNIATGKITGIPRPVTLNGLRAVSYYGDNANVSFVSQDGGFTVRNCGKDALAKGNNAIGGFTYITDGTML